MSVTLTNLRTIFYDLLREEEDSSAYPYTLSDLMLNSAQQRICSWRVINPLTKEEARKGELSFLNTTSYYSNVQPTTLTADTTVWATTLTVASASDYDSSGSLYISGNIVAYTWTTSTTFTWVTGVLFAFTSWTEVSPAFVLPSDYASAIGVTYNNKFKLEPKQFDDIFEDLNNRKGNTYNRNDTRAIYEDNHNIRPFYTIIDNWYLVPFWLTKTLDSILFRYEKIATEMTATTDTATIDNDIYAKTTIPYIAAWEMLFNRWEEARAKEILNFGIWQVKEVYTYYNNASYEKISWVQYKMGKSRLNI